MIKITCPKCGVDSSISLVQPSYQGPHKCWQCKELFNIQIENNMLKYCEPLSQEEYEKQRELEALRKKFTSHSGD